MGREGWEAFEAWNLAVDFFFLIDLVLNFRTGFLVDGQLVTDAKRVARHYLRSQLRAFDLIGSFPLNWLLPSLNDDDSQSSSAGRAKQAVTPPSHRQAQPAIAALQTVLKPQVRRARDQVPIRPLMRVVKLIVAMLGCCHWMGCAWWFVADMRAGGFIRSVHSLQ